MKQFQSDEVFDTCNPDTFRRYRNRIICFEDPPAVRMSSLGYNVRPQSNLLDPVSDNDLFPLFAIRVRPMDRISVWCTGITKPPISVPPATPYRMELQPRVGFDCTSFAPAPRIIQPPGWAAPDQTSALLFQFTGIEATQFELWGCTIPNGAPPGTQYVTFAVLISQSGACCGNGPGYWRGDWDVTP